MNSLDALRVVVSREPPVVSARLRKLLRRFDEADPPSIAPHVASGLTKCSRLVLVKSWLNRFSRPS